MDISIREQSLAVLTEVSGISTVVIRTISTHASEESSNMTNISKQLSIAHSKNISSLEQELGHI